MKHTPVALLSPEIVTSRTIELGMISSLPVLSAGPMWPSKYNSFDGHMGPALKTGKLDIIPNSIVREVTISGDNKATGVCFIDRTTRAEGEVRARCVVVS